MQENQLLLRMKITNICSWRMAAELTTTEESLSSMHRMNIQTELPFCIPRVDARTLDFAQLYVQLSNELLLATLVTL